MRTLLIILVLLTPSISSADGVDPLAFIQRLLDQVDQKLQVFNSRVNNVLQLNKLKNARQQLKKLEFQLRSMKRQEENQKKQIETMTGKYGYSKAFKKYYNARRYQGPANEGELFSNGKNNSPHMNEYLDLFSPDDPLIHDKKRNKSSSNVQRQTTDAAILAYIETKNQTDTEKLDGDYEKLDAMIDEIDATDNLKSSSDLQTRHIAELHRSVMELKLLVARSLKLKTAQVTESNKKRENIQKFVERQR